MRIAVIGSGYVGLVAAGCFADLGHTVTCVDKDEDRVAELNSGGVPIYEDYLPELLARHRGISLFFSTSLPVAVRDASVIFIAVGTPMTANGEADLSFVESVARSVARAVAREVHSYKLIVEKSTVPVCTSASIERVMVLNGCRRNDFDVASNPEFLREGSAVSDFLYPDRIIVGASSDRARKLLREVYRPLIDGTYARQASSVPKPETASPASIYIETSTQSAELVKHSCNAFLAVKISFINAVAAVCEAVGADIEDVCRGIGSDTRIGPRFLRAGIGYGGSCFPKDIAAFRSAASEHGYKFELLDEVHRINEQQRERFLKKVRAALWTLKDKRLAVLGLAFKDGTDDVRESPAIEIIKSLLAEGCRINAFDPAAMDRAKEILGHAIDYASDPYDAATGADALLILTEWKEFAALDLVRIRELLNYPIVLDGRNLYSPKQMAQAKLDYYSMGRTPVKIAHAMPTEPKVQD